MQENSGIPKARIFPFVFTTFSFVSKRDLRRVAPVALFSRAPCDLWWELGKWKLKKVLVNSFPQTAIFQQQLSTLPSERDPVLRGA